MGEVVSDLGGKLLTVGRSSSTRSKTEPPCSEAIDSSNRENFFLINVMNRRRCSNRVGSKPASSVAFSKFLKTGFRKLSRDSSVSKKSAGENFNCS